MYRYILVNLAITPGVVVGIEVECVCMCVEWSGDGAECVCVVHPVLCTSVAVT